MASVAGEASSSSPPSASIPPPRRSCTYDVFLSFGGNTRNGFIDHLYAALDRKGIKTFIDDKDLKSGEVIKDGLWKAIKESMVAITVFTPNYASSSWCLDELQHIVECSKNLGLSIVPVFYGVERSDVRYQKGSFKEAFEKHEKRFGENSERVRRWRDALARAASLPGKDFKDEHEATFVEGIAEHIHKLIPKLPSSTNNLVGIASRVEEVMRHIDIGLDDVRLIGIWGMGGIGKTTIAKAVYEAIQGEFKVSCFLTNVREAYESNRIIDKQKQLLAKANISVNTSDDEYDVQEKIQTSLCNKKVLLVLDDASDEVQLRNLAGEQNWFGPGSRIIITTRDIHLLKIYEVHGIYEVQGLIDAESSYLFRLKAFKQKNLDETYLDLAKEVVQYCGGLPLALEVLGSHLCERSVDDWHDAIEKKKGPPFDKIHDTLKISYNSLDAMEKNIFLDLACFFEGQQTDGVIKLLEICGYNARIGINILIDRSLVKINEETNVFEMHGLLQDMGRSIIIQESPTNPAERSRLWSGEDIDLILKNNKGSEAIQAMVLRSGWSGRHWSAKAFSNMTQLKLLIIDSAEGFHDLSSFPTSLKVLSYRGYPLKTLPLPDQQHEFVEIKLKYSNIENLWHGKKFLGKLKYLNLSYSSQLKQTPDLSEVPRLQTLVLKGCSSLTEVHPSVVHHKSLTLLDLTECRMLKALPGKLEMSSLNELILDDCSSFENLPEFGECMKSLSRLSLERTPIEKLPTSLGSLVGLKDLNTRGCKNIECLRDIIDGIPLSRTLSSASVVGEASSSSPPSTSIIPPPRSCTYHVFLSFRGIDTRKGITGHLHAALETKGIKTYIDDRDLKMSEVIKDKLLKAIEESMFAITVFSPNYASSSWCLDELHKIVECSKNMGLEVVPVFYGVEPSDVRYQKGSFEEAFKKHEKRFGQNSEKIRRWRDALAEVALLSGKDFKDEHEATLVKSIADHIHKKLIPKLPSSTKNLVGIASRVEEVIRRIGMGLNDVRFIGIWGMGGIGKTTIARAVYEAIQGEFEASCFLANVREACERNRIVDKQNELVAQANTRENIFYNEYEGRRVIQHSLSNKKALLVLDDVSDEVQLKNLAEEKHWFGPGSRIIITTRDIQLLNIYEVYSTYKVQGLVDSESSDLFHLIAFKQKKLDEKCLDLAKEVVKYSGGLPLALEVLGSYLCGRSVDIWNDAIEKMKSTPIPKIHDTLKISYDSLDVMEKNIFLDIACFFEGEKTDYVTKLFEMCGYNARIGIEILVDRSLVKINEESNVLEMHDLLQEMGRNVVIEESPNDPGKRSRLWFWEDIDLVLANNKGSEAIQGIVSRLSWPIKYGRRWSAEAFSNMAQLKFLIITDKEDDFCELSSLPTSLKVLDWRIYPFKTLPLSDQPYKLVEIKLRESHIENLWHGKKFLGKLKYLDLSGSHQLKQTPDLSEVPLLQTLLLKHCLSLTEVHPSLVHHKSLTLLDLTGCYKLEALPGKLEMSSLNELILDDCFEFKNLPEFGECMKSLSRLSLAWTAIEKLPTSLGCLVGLKNLNIRGCDNIECLRDIAEGIPLLRTLNLASVVGEASSSSPPSTSIPPRPQSRTYDVFLSFSRKDTRKGITGHLYAALERKGIETFIDDKDLKTGEVISSELPKAIEESMFAITVFSPNYASSSWCLNELQHIVERWKNRGLSIVPVFYGVEHWDVRSQKGSFKEAFEKHEKRFGENSERVRIWRDALVQVANLSGFDFNYMHEATVVEGIAKHIHKKLIPKELPSSTKNLVGIASRVEKVMRHINIGLNDVRFIGIWGMSGIGKTTIARAVYKAIRGKFESSCFLANIRETCKRNGIVNKQKELVAQANRRSITFDNEYVGRRVIQDLLCTKKVLLVLDDVGDKVQLRNLAGEENWFGPGSRIIITTRDRFLLEIHNVHQIYKVQDLVDSESFDLFCLKAFKQKKLDEKHLNLAKEVVKYSGGLPLALEVLGSHFCGRSVHVWHDAIEKIKSTPFAKIHDRLKISYDCLDEMDKNIFLDIACFFEGKEINYVTKLLEIYGYDARIGIDLLIERSLVKINEETNVLEMHNLLQNMGRSIVIQESPNNPGKRSRLWSREDIGLVLGNNKGSKAVQGIVLWSGWFGEHWSAEAFSNMTQLKLLIIDSVEGLRDLCSLPASLKVLHCWNYPLKTLPLPDQQYEVVEIRLNHSDIENRWHGKKFLGELKYLNLSYSIQLKQTPDLSEVPILQTLVLKHCYGLTEVHPSLVHHKSLTLLDLSECGDLKALPGKLHMRSLNELILDDCSSFENLPEFGECMKSLSRLSLKRTSIKKLPTSLGCLVGLQDLNLADCKDLECLPDTIDGIPLLRTLNLSYCNLTEESFPPDFGHFPSLTDLDLRGNDFVSIPISIHELPKLKCLKLSCCYKLRCLPKLPSSIRELEACYCESLEISEVNILSKVCGVFVSPSQDSRQVLLEMVIPGSEIPPWFDHRQDGNSISIPCGYPRNERLGIALCFQLIIDDESFREFGIEERLGFALVVRDGNNSFNTNRTTAKCCIDDNLCIIFLTNDYFTDGFHEGTCFKLSILDEDLSSEVSVTSAARWVSIEDIKRFEEK